jgi:hypothetical protein
LVWNVYDLGNIQRAAVEVEKDHFLSCFHSC